MPDSLLQRFGSDSDGRRRLLDQLLRQDLVGGSPELAEALGRAVQLHEVPEGALVIGQDSLDSDIFLLIVGEVAVEVHGREVARRHVGQHFGEMALIDPSQRRSAGIRATAPSVVARISEPTFTALATDHPILWRRLALELGNRLRQRSGLIRPRSPHPSVFVGSCSSALGLDIARALQAAFAHDPWITRIWTDGVFGAGSTPIESLVGQLDAIDFALMVVTPDDITTTGDAGTPSPRDNVVFELGLTMGALGRDRAFMVKVRAPAGELRIPSDLAGMKALEVVPGRPEDLPARVGPAAAEFRGVVRRLGGR